MNPYAGVVLSAYEVWNMEYNVLVNLSADDMGPIPEVATSWERSPTASPGPSTCVTTSSGPTASRSPPLTSCTRSSAPAKEEWSNFSPFTEGFTKVTAPDATTVVITTKEPDPRLPSLPVYILPKHVWEKYGPKKVGGFSNNDPVTSGPFRLTAWNKGSYFEMTANKNYFAGKPAVDKVRFRIFRNDEAMAAALKNGEIDAIYNLSPELAGQLEGESNITPINAQDGSFTQLTINTGSGDDRQRPPGARRTSGSARRSRTPSTRTALVERVLQGLGTPGSVHERRRRAEVEPQDPRRPADEVRPRRGEPDPRRRGIQEGLGRHPHHARRLQEAEPPLLLPVRRRDLPRDVAVHQGMARRTSASTPPRRPRARTSSRRSRTRASSTSSSGRGRRTPTRRR